MAMTDTVEGFLLVGDLRKILAGLPDEMPVVGYWEHHYCPVDGVRFATVTGYLWDDGRIGPECLVLEVD